RPGSAAIARSDPGRKHHAVAGQLIQASGKRLDTYAAFASVDGAASILLASAAYIRGQQAGGRVQHREILSGGEPHFPSSNTVRVSDGESSPACSHDRACKAAFPQAGQWLSSVPSGGTLPC